MKKLLYLSAAALAITFAACDKSGGDSAADQMAGFDSLFTQVQTDSLVRAFGEAFGANVNLQLCANDSNFNRNALLKGLRSVINTDTAYAYNVGMQIGMQMKSMVVDLEAQGLKVDKQMLVTAFTQVLMDDSITRFDANSYQMAAQKFQQDFMAAQRKFEKAKLEQSPEAIENLAKGKAYVDSVVKAGATQLPSGVAVKVENAGGDKKLSASSRANLNFTVSTADGRVVEKTASEPRLVRVSTRPTGFQDGVALLGEGGKATIYVPGNEAYGVEDARNRFGLGPNEMLVYEVEVVSIEE